MRLVTLIDLGAGSLPAQTPAPARFARWFPVVHQPAVVPPVDGAGSTPVADGVLLEWDAVESGGAVVIYVIERSAAPDGPWEEIVRTTETRYLYSDGSGQTWYFRITATVRGQAGGSEVVVGTPELVAKQEAVDQAIQDAAEAKLKAADALLLIGDEYDPEAEYAQGGVVYLTGRMYRAVANVPLETPPPNTDYWQDIGTITEAQGATMSAVQQMRVDVDESGVEIASLTERVGNSEASVTSLMSVVGNTIPLRNAGFEDGIGKNIPGWSSTRGAPSPLSDVVYTVVTNPHTGGRCMRFGHTATTGPEGTPGLDAHAIAYNDAVYPVAVGDRLRMSFWSRVTNNPSTSATIRPYLHFIDAAGERIDYTVSGIVQIPISQRNWTLHVMPPIPVPTGAVGVCMDIRTAGGTLPITNCQIYFDDVRLERVSETEGQMMARHTVALDVNGNVSGTINENDGERSSFSILATVFRVLTGSSASGMEWQANYIRIYGNGYQMVLGTGFGASNNLVQWFGPNIGVAACTTANCTEAKTITGETIIRGSNSQGRMEITATKLSVFDTNNIARIELGLL